MGGGCISSMGEKSAVSAFLIYICVQTCFRYYVIILPNGVYIYQVILYRVGHGLWSPLDTVLLFHEHSSNAADIGRHPCQNKKNTEFGDVFYFFVFSW